MSIRVTYTGGDATLSAAYTGGDATLTVAPAVVAPSPPNAPATLTAAPTGTGIALVWAASGGATSYTVQRSVAGSGSWADVVTQVGTTYTDTPPSAGTKYSYRVRATNAIGDSGYSPTASMTAALGSYWTFNASGGLTDIVNARTLTASGTVTDQTGAIDGAKGFAGASWLAAANNSLDYLRAGFSVGFWVYPAALGAGRVFICRDPFNGNNREWYFLDTPGFAVCNSAGAAFNATSSIAPTINAWNHVFGTFDGINARVYVNGALGGTSATLTGTLTPGYVQEMRIGADTSGNRRFIGRIDEVGIFHTTLTLSEIQALYASGAGSRPY